MSLKRPSYFFRMVFLVLRYRGQPLARAIWNELRAKSPMDLSVLYIPMATPPVSGHTRTHSAVYNELGHHLLDIYTVQ